MNIMPVVICTPMLIFLNTLLLLWIMPDCIVCRFITSTSNRPIRTDIIKTVTRINMLPLR